jgi:hypothetical protein
MPRRREVGSAGTGRAVADHLPVLPIAENLDDQRESGRLLVLALRGVRPGLERGTTPSGEPAGARRAVDMSRGRREGDPE